MYEQYYRLKESPFRLAPDSGYFYASPAHRRALAYLRYGLARREGFIVVTGRPGTGKTTLAQALLAEARQERVVVGTLNTTHLDADDTLRMVAASFGLPHEAQPKATTLKRLEAYFSERVRAAEHVLLVVDEAQNLPLTALEELRMLSNFQLGNHALIQIFLLGQQQFRDMLNGQELEQLRQRVVAACHLNPLSPQETRGYIEHRLRHSGWSGVPRITDLAFGMIHAVTEGIPRRINTFCDRLFLYGALEELDLLNEQAVSAVHQELSSEGVFDPVSLQLEQVEPVPPLEEEDPVPPSGEALAYQDKHETSGGDSASSSAAAPTPDPTLPGTGNAGMRERIHVVAGGGGEHPGGAEAPASRPAPLTLPEPHFPPAVAAALEFHRRAEKRGPWLDPATPLPEGMLELLQIAVGKDDDFPDSAWESLGTDRREMREAARHFIREVCFIEGGDYFRHLGLRKDADAQQIREHYRLLFRMLQPKEGEENLQWSRRLVKAVNRAYNTLRNEERREAYLARLRRSEENEATPAVDEDAPAWARVGNQAESSSPQSPPVAEEASETRGGAPGWVWSGLIVALLLVAVGLYFTLNERESRRTEAGTSLGETREIPLPPRENGILRERGPSTSQEMPAEPQGLPGAAAPQRSPAPSRSAADVEPRPSEGRTAGSPASRVTAEPSRSAATGGERPSEQARPEQKPPAAVASPAGDSPAETTEPVDSVAVSQERVQGETVAEDAPVRAGPQTVEEGAGVAVVTAPSQPHGLSLPALQALMKGVFSAYASGDLEAFMSHFAPTAFTNDRTDLEGIRRDYRELFLNTERRKMQADLAWEMLDEQRARGEGRFVVTVQPKGAREARIVTGTLVVQVILDEQGMPRINGLFHTYDRTR